MRVADRATWLVTSGGRLSKLMRLIKTHGSLNEIFALEATPDDWGSDAELRAFVRDGVRPGLVDRR